MTSVKKCESHLLSESHLISCLPLSSETQGRELFQQGEEPTTSQNQLLNELVVQFKDVFSTKPGLTHLVRHEMKTQSFVIVHPRPYRVLEPPPCLQNRGHYNDALWHHGGIQEHLVIVPKLDRSFRLCNNFRQLNKVLELKLI